MSKPKITSDNAVSYDFGTKFKLVQLIKGCKKEVKLLSIPEKSAFWGLFDSQNLDFEIVIDNSRNNSDVRFAIKFRDESSDIYFIIRGSKSGVLKAIKNHGSRLHFVSQQGTDNPSAKRESFVKCSQITFSIELKKTDEEYEEDEQLMEEARKKKLADRKLREAEIKNETINVKVKAIDGRETELVILSTYFIEDIKELIEDQLNIPKNRQRLIFNNRQLEDGCQASDYNIQNGDILLLILKFVSGEYCQKEIISDAANHLNSVERSAVCFGQKADQRFGCYAESFNVSEKIKAKPFTVELRTRSKYSL